VKLIHGRGWIFEQIDFFRKLDHEDFVVGSRKRVIDKMDAGQALVAQFGFQVGAGLADEAEGDGRGLRESERGDRLNMAVVGEG
jgi:hypothetical protein